MTDSIFAPEHAKPAPVSFPIHPLLQERWSPRAFAEAGLGAHELHTLFEAVRWTPSAFNEQPWAFLVATRQQPEKFSALLRCLSENNQVWAQKAAGIAITVIRQNLQNKPTPNRTAHYDLGQAVANFTFQATALGIVVHQVAGLDLALAQTVGGIPQGFEPVTAIAFGRPGNAASLPEAVRSKDAAPRKRKPVHEFVFAERWNTPTSW